MPDPDTVERRCIERPATQLHADPNDWVRYANRLEVDLERAEAELDPANPESIVSGLQRESDDNFERAERAEARNAEDGWVRLDDVIEAIERAPDPLDNEDRPTWYRLDWSHYIEAKLSTTEGDDE